MIDASAGLALDVGGVVVGLAAGALLAMLFLAGLWETVSRLVRVERPWLLFGASLILRLALVLGVFYLLLADGNWQRGLAALAAFAVVRTLITWRVRRRAGSRRTMSQGSLS
jgi:F1F0 ATPase subunit 2